MVKLKAYAKLNLSLDVIGKRQDGYHELDMIMQSISLYDIVELRPSSDIHVHMDKGNVDEKSNTAYAAAKVFLDYTGKDGVEISIQKHIPSMSGMGGSSADAAAVLIGLNRLYNTQLDKETLMALGKTVGADVPFSLFGGTARAKGIGEKLRRLTPVSTMHYVVVKPKIGISTAEAFKQYRHTHPVKMDSVEYALQKGDLSLYYQFADNTLSMPAVRIAPDILKTVTAMQSAGAEKALMTGSGSSFFSVFKTAQEANAVAQRVTGDFELCGAYQAKDIGIELIGE